MTQNPLSTKIATILQPMEDVGVRVLALYGIGEHGCLCGQLGCSSAGKHPLAATCASGVYGASDDPDVVRDWIETYPACNVGIACGREVIVVDLDGDEAVATFKRWCDEFGSVGDAPLVKTGRGYHCFFADDSAEPFASRSFPELKIDVKCEGGYVVAPPSMHINGSQYEWLRPLTADVASPPGWLASMIRSGREPVKASDRRISVVLPPAKHTFETAPEVGAGGRHAMLRDLIARDLGRGVAVEEVAARARKYRDGKCIHDPLAAGRAGQPVPDSEIDKLIGDYLSRFGLPGPGPPGSAGKADPGPGSRDAATVRHFNFTWPPELQSDGSETM